MTVSFDFVHLGLFLDANMGPLMSGTSDDRRLRLDVHVTRPRAKTRRGLAVLTAPIVLGMSRVNHLHETLRSMWSHVPWTYYKGDIDVNDTGPALGRRG